MKVYCVSGLKVYVLIYYNMYKHNKYLLLNSRPLSL